MEILNNPWVIGIGGGVLSGLLVTLVTRYLFSKRDNREYTQKVVTANQEILYAVRPGISEGVIPATDVLKSLISATALKYGVDAQDLHSTTSFADALVKEVMDSSFLAASAKAEFCQKLNQLRPQPDLMQASPNRERELNRDITRLSEYRQRMISRMSIMLGAMAATMTIVFALSRLLGGSRLELRSKDVFLLVPTVTVILVVTVTTYAMWMFRLIDRKRSDKRTSQSANLDNKMDEEEIHNQ